MAYSLTDALPYLIAMEEWMASFETRGRTYRDFYRGLEPHSTRLLRIINTPDADWRIAEQFNAIMLGSLVHRSFLMRDGAHPGDAIALVNTPAAAPPESQLH